MSTEERTINEPLIERLAGHLKVSGYSLSATVKRMAAARGFLLYLAKERVDVANATGAHEPAFLAFKLNLYRKRHGHAPCDLSSWRWGYTSGVHIVMRLAQGKWPPATVPANPQETFRQDLCNAYAQWLSDVRGLAATTIPNRKAEAQRFLESLGERGGDELLLPQITVADLDLYLTQRAPQLRRTTRQRLALCLRGFLRYLQIQGLIQQDLSGSVVSPRRYAFEGIPPALRAEHVNAVLQSAKKDHTPKGLRDQAILLLLATYGLRSGEVTALRLDDIDWRKDRLRVRHSKTGCESFLPLLAPVGEAILAYLRNGRPQTKAREVFLRVRAPFQGLHAGGSIYHIVAHQLRKAGVILKRKHGPHAFRHARAVGLLNAGVAMKTIGDVLGHRSLDSTSIYLRLCGAPHNLRYEYTSVSIETPRGSRGNNCLGLCGRRG